MDKKLLFNAQGTYKTGNLLAEKECNQEIGQGQQIEYSFIQISSHSFCIGSVCSNFTAHGTLCNGIICQEYCECNNTERDQEICVFDFHLPNIRRNQDG